MRDLFWSAALVVALLVFGAFLVVVVLEAAVGCGSTYVDSEGVRHQYECLFREVSHD
jgi:hypothetical protein